MIAFKTSPKFPRIPHLPFSPGGTRDDLRLTPDDLERTLLGKPLVLTEKMDGSNVCLERDAIFARSHTGLPGHPSFDLLKSFHATVRDSIPERMSVFGEWLLAKHSIHYTNLTSYLQLFAVRHCPPAEDGHSPWDTWGSWDEVEQMAAALGCSAVPDLERGTFASAGAIERAILQIMARFDHAAEGVVVRVAAGFGAGDFHTSVAKWVRVNHVQTDEHWTRQRIVKNRLAAVKTWTAIDPELDWEQLAVELDRLGHESRPGLRQLSSTD